MYVLALNARYIALYLPFSVGACILVSRLIHIELGTIFYKSFIYHTCIPGYEHLPIYPPPVAPPFALHGARARMRRRAYIMKSLRLVVRPPVVC